MKIVLNGREEELGAGATVSDLIDSAGLSGRRVAIEVNAEIVPRSAYASRVLAAGDRIEVVHAVGGG